MFVFVQDPATTDIYTYVHTLSLHVACPILAPDHDWAWLAVLVANLKRAATSTRDKRPHMVDPHALYELGISLMTDARSWALNGNYHAATVGRAGLIIALLICCPVRIANLTAIEIGNHLIGRAHV